MKIKKYIYYFFIIMGFGYPACAMEQDGEENSEERSSEIKNETQFYETIQALSKLAHEIAEKRKLIDLKDYTLHNLTSDERNSGMGTNLEQELDKLKRELINLKMKANTLMQKQGLCSFYKI